MTQQLTEKSDVYSFGVLLLEVITARKPLERGRYIVREVKGAMDRTKDLYGLHELLDPMLAPTSLAGFELYVDLALKCVEEAGMDRPSMSEVVAEIEKIMKMAGVNPKVDSASNSMSYNSRTPRHPYSGESQFDYSGGIPSSSRVEPKWSVRSAHNDLHVNNLALVCLCTVHQGSELLRTVTFFWNFCMIN